jgi:succinate dehydrogenase/fumarate reductase flavoprotein subunit
MKVFDVVVVGSGVGGMTAAVVAAQHGLEVLVVEKTEFFGGTTAFSGGVAWIPNNHHMAEVGVADSREMTLEYLRNVLGNHYDAAKIEAFVDNAPAMLRYMEANTALDFVPTPTPDYEQQHSGASHYRGVLAREFDGRRLGSYFSYLRRPRSELTVFDSMQVAGADIIPLRKAFRSIKGFSHTTRMVLSYAVQKLRYGRGTRVVSGNALAARLLRSALDANVTLWRETPARKLVIENGRVTGIVVLRDGSEVTIAARHAVMMASGGFGSNEEMRRQFMPLAEHHVSVQPEGNVGDGVRMGVEVGADLVTTNPANAIFIPVSMAQRPDGSWAKFPHIMIDRYMPGSIAVDPAGKRFVNEGASYHNFVMTMHQLGLPKAYMIADRRFLRTYGMGLARPFPYPVRPWVRNGYLAEAPTIGALAEKIGISPKVLEQTVSRFNEHASNGEDPDFARGADVHSRFRGDQENKPNPSLGPILKPPFYAMTMLPGDLSSVAGLNTDERARVLTKAGEVIPGFYALGLDMNSMTKGFYPGGGSSLGPGLTFGYIAARDIAAAARKQLRS